MLTHPTRFGALLAVLAIAIAALAPTIFAETPGDGPDLDMQPVVSFTAPEAITEGEPAVFTFTRVGGLSSDLALNLDFFLEGQFLRDYEIGEVRFAASEATAVLSIPTEDDNTPEPDGYIGVHLQPRYYTPGVPQPYNPEPPFYQEVAVRDNDNPAVTGIAVHSSLK